MEALVMVVGAMGVGGWERSRQRRLRADQPIDCFMLRGEHIGGQATNGGQGHADPPTIDVRLWRTKQWRPTRTTAKGRKRTSSIAAALGRLHSEKARQCRAFLLSKERMGYLVLGPDNSLTSRYQW